MTFAETFKALSDPARREILEILKQGPMSAGEIGAHFDMTGATISYHLKVLKQADLVFETREKNYIYYQLNTTVLEEILLWISELKGGDDHETDRFSHFHGIGCSSRRGGHYDDAADKPHKKISGESRQQN